MEKLAARVGRTLFATWHSQFNNAVDKAATILLTRHPLREAVDRVLSKQGR
jgi:hypothetical protein